MTGASVETTLVLWASSLREVKSRMRPLFAQLPFHLARFAAGGERAERELLSRLPLPSPPREIERARDLARRHCPYLGWRIISADQRVDSFRNFAPPKSAAIAPSRAARGSSMPRELRLRARPGGFTRRRKKHEGRPSLSPQN
jgi:hypothetical protein